jgi:hypothetical protein
MGFLCARELNLEDVGALQDPEAAPYLLGVHDQELTDERIA